MTLRSPGHKRPTRHESNPQALCESLEPRSLLSGAVAGAPDLPALESDPSAPIDSTPWIHSYGKYGELSYGHATATINRDGNLLVLAYGVPLDQPYYVTTPTWQAFVIRPPSGSTFGSELVTWQYGREVLVAVTTDHGVLLYDAFTGEHRDLTAETGGTSIVSSLVKLEYSDGGRLLGGLDASGDLVLYGQHAITSDPVDSHSWAFDNLSQSAFRNLGHSPPEFDTVNGGRLVGYSTPWGGLNITGVNAEGRVIVAWTAPGQRGWYGTDLSQVVGTVDGYDDRAFGQLDVTVSEWGGINIYDGTDGRTFWWAPALGGQWRYADLAEDSVGSAPDFTAATAYTASWGGLNMAGVDSNGNLYAYWWAPGASGWTAEQLDDDFTHAAFVGSLSAATPPGYLNIFARDTDGHVHWLSLTGPAQWTDFDVTASEPDITLL